MSIDWYYPTKLQEVQTTFCEGLEELLIGLLESMEVGKDTLEKKKRF